MAAGVSDGLWSLGEPAEHASQSMTTIYVFLPGEAIPVWAPADAEHVHEDVYRIVDCRNEGENMQFGKGTLVRCRLEKRSGDFGAESETLVAYEAVQQN